MNENENKTYNPNLIEKITPPKLPRGLSVSLGKKIAKLKRISGVNEDLLGSLTCNPICSDGSKKKI